MNIFVYSKPPETLKKCRYYLNFKISGGGRAIAILLQSATSWRVPFSSACVRPRGPDSFLVALLISRLVKRKMNCFPISRSIFSSLLETRYGRNKSNYQSPFNRDASVLCWFSFSLDLGAALFSIHPPLNGSLVFRSEQWRSNCYKALYERRHLFERAAP